MKDLSVNAAVSRVSYFGSGIIAGRSADGLNAVSAYFIMGRSPLSRNRKFTDSGTGLKIEAHIQTAIKNEERLLYNPVIADRGLTVMGNGSHTEQIYKALKSGQGLNDINKSLYPFDDEPYFTPRIFAVSAFAGEKMCLTMGITKNCSLGITHQVFDYPDIPAGTACFLHSFEGDEEPLPSFTGEPMCVLIGGSIFDIVANVWENLNSFNKVALYVRNENIKTGQIISRIINKNR